MKSSINCFLKIAQPLFIVLLLTPWAFAQENEEETGLLPDIKSQDIEIRGEFKARFPGLRRQPILGFNPELRIYQFPSDRIPYMEKHQNALADVEISEFSPVSGPQYNPLQYADIHNLFARLGAGSYKSREAQIWSAIPINEQSYFGLDLDFTSSSEGHITDRASEFRYFSGNIEYGVKLNDLINLYAFAGLKNDFNYAARFGNQNLDNIARIEFKGLNGGFELSGFKNEVTGWRLKGNIRSFRNLYKTEYWPGRIDETVYKGSFSYQWALGHPGEIITAEANARAGNYEADNNGGQQWSTLYAGLSYERLFNYTTRLYIEGNLYHTSDFAEDKVWPGAKVKLSQWLGDRLKITGRAEAKPSLKTVEQIHEQNRFTGYNNKLRHSYVFQIDAEASLKWYRGSRLYGGAEYMNAQNYSYFIPQTKTAPNKPPHDYYATAYDNATNMKIYVGIAHQLAPNTFWLNGRLYIQNPLLSNDEAIPYSENWGIKASAAYRPIERITIKGWTRFLADRTAGNDANITFAKNELKNIFLVGGQLDVRIVDGVGAYFKVVNLLDQEYRYWQGYIERPLQLYGGITVTF